MEQRAAADAGSKPVVLSHSHGYRIDGDTAALHAELAIVDAHAAAARSWALQLWACDAPYAGGALAGKKVAETPIELAHVPSTTPLLAAEGFAEAPAGQRAFSMVLVLASGAPGRYDELHDFANYPALERFSVPSFDGAPRLERAEDGGLHVLVGQVVNPRSADNLSGSLCVECWSGDLTRGAEPAGAQPVAVVELGRLAGEARLPVAALSLSGASGDAGVTVRLREWTAQGYLTRDSAFCAPLTRPAPVAQPVTALPVAAQAEQPAAQPAVAAPATVAQPVATAVAKPVAAAAPATVAKPVAAAVAKPVAVAAPAAVAAQPARKRVSLARASEAELAAVPGLNAKLAAAIVKARPFANLDALTRVRGIGAKMVDKLRSELTVD